MHHFLPVLGESFVDMVALEKRVGSANSLISILLRVLKWGGHKRIDMKLMRGHRAIGIKLRGFGYSVRGDLANAQMWSGVAVLIPSHAFVTIQSTM